MAEGTPHRETLESPVEIFGTEMSIETTTRLDSRDINPFEVRSSGSIPTELGEFTRLTFLWLNNRGLEGTIPTEIGRLTALTSLDLVNNELTGPLPKELFDLTALTRIRLHNNNISGSIPSELGKLTKLRNWEIQQNNFDLECDCNLLSWYPTFTLRQEITVSSDACSSINGYEGIYPHLLRSDTRAPCTHALFDDVITSNGTDISVGWSYSSLRKDMSTFKDGEDILKTYSYIDFEGMNSSFRSCSSFMSPNSTVSKSLDEDTNAGRGFGFQLKYRLGNIVETFCYWMEELLDVAPPNYAITLSDLVPASSYEVVVTPMYLYFSYYQEDPGLENTSWIANPVTYTLGTESRVLRVQTADGVPTSSPFDLRTSANGGMLDIEWDEPLEANGDIRMYQVQVTKVDDDTVVHEAETSFRTITLGLHPSTEYSIRLRARTDVFMYGPYSTNFSAFTCPENTYRTFTEQECLANSGYFTTNDEAKACAADLMEALEDNACLVSGLSIAALPLRPGFWRESLTSLRFLQCPVEEFCAQSNNSIQVNSPNDYCAPHHQGIYCSGCSDGYVLTVDGCLPCNDDELLRSKLSVVVLVFLVLLVLACLLFKVLYAAGLFQELKKRKQKLKKKMVRMLSSRFSSVESQPAQSRLGPQKQSSQNVWSKLSTLQISTKLRILCGFFQVLFSYQRTFQSQALRDGFSGLAHFVTSLDVTVIVNSLRLRCTWDYTHYDSLLFLTLLPLAIIGTLYLLCSCVACKYRALTHAISQQCTSAVLLVFFLVYPSISQTIFETFWCENFIDADGVEIFNSALRSDYRENCEYGIERVGWCLYAALMALVYPVGVVVLYLALLWRYRPLIDKRNKTSFDEDQLKQVSFLIDPYTDSCFWFEPYELVRKLLQTSFVGFLQNLSNDFSSVLALISQNLSILSIVFLMFISPYKKSSDFAFALVSLLLLLPVAQFSILDTNANKGLLQPGIVAVVVLEMVCFVLFPCIESFWSSHDKDNTLIELERPLPKVERPCHEDDGLNTNLLLDVDSDYTSSQDVSAHSPNATDPPSVQSQSAKVQPKPSPRQVTPESPDNST